MKASPIPAEAEGLAQTLVKAGSPLVIAVWGGTARNEMTPLSDLDMVCWNPHRVSLPDLAVRDAAYLDLVVCSEDQAGLLRWAAANATDLHAIMFARRIAGDTSRAAQFDEIVDSLWRDSAVCAREVYHLIATSVSVARLYGRAAYRPEKFALGATRSWNVLAECGQLYAGTSRPGGTEANLAQMAEDGLIDHSSTTAFVHAMRLRRECEAGKVRVSDLADDYVALAEQYLATVARFMLAIRPWLQRHAPLSPATFDLMGADLLQVPRWARGEPANETGESETMMQAFLSRDAMQLNDLLLNSPHRPSWWVRHAAILNANLAPAALRSIVDEVTRAQSWWPDRNLILYALRHPAADEQLLDHLHSLSHLLRPMDREALARRRRASIDKERQRTSP